MRVYLEAGCKTGATGMERSWRRAGPPAPPGDGMHAQTTRVWSTMFSQGRQGNSMGKLETFQQMMLEELDT